MKLGAQLYTIREFTQTERKFSMAMKKIAAIGYNAVQLSAAGPIPAETVRKICDRHGLSIIATHTNPDRVLHETEQVIAEHQTMGASYVGIGSMPGKYRDLPDKREGIQNFIADFKPAAQKIQEAGLKFTYHNHAFEFEKVDGITGLETIAQGFEPELLSFVLDVYWVQHAGGDPAHWIKKFASHIEIIHAKDMAVVENQPRMAPVMEGNLNWKRILKACKTAKVKWAFVEQDNCYGEDPYVCLEKSVRNYSRFISDL